MTETVKHMASKLASYISFLLLEINEIVVMCKP